MAKVNSEGAAPKRTAQGASGKAGRAVGGGGVGGGPGGVASGAAQRGHGVPQLSGAKIEAELAALPEWARVGDAIQRTYFFKDFLASMAFVDKVAQAAEADAHHPDILIRYNKVTLTLSTHDAGGISHKDFALAAKADALGGGG